MKGWTNWRALQSPINYGFKVRARRSTARGCSFGPAALLFRGQPAPKIFPHLPLAQKSKMCKNLGRFSPRR